jgi:hypothetical protein
MKSPAALERAPWAPIRLPSSDALDGSCAAQGVVRFLLIDQQCVFAG